MPSLSTRGGRAYLFVCVACELWPKLEALDPLTMLTQEQKPAPVTTKQISNPITYCFEIYLVYIVPCD